MVTNDAYVYGEVVTQPTLDHIKNSVDIYCFIIKVMRLSGAYDTLPVQLPGQLLVRHKIMQGAMIGVVGQFRSYSYRDCERRHLRLYIFALEIGESLPTVTNYIAISGTLCKPPVYRVTPYGREVTDLLIAVNRPNERLDYLPVIVWNGNARFTSALAPGTHLVLIGRMQSREYNKVLPDGNAQRGTAYEVSAFFTEVTEEIVSVEDYKREVTDCGNVF